VQDFSHPLMSFPSGLLRPVPNLATAGTRRLLPLEGIPPSLSYLAPACPFAPRCSITIDFCRAVDPELIEHGIEGEEAACLRAEDIASCDLPAQDSYPRHEPIATRVRDDRAANILEVTGLQKHFPLLKGAVIKRQIGTVRAVDGIDLEIKA